MKLLSAAQIGQWDRYTIEHEPVSSINLMERAAKACTKWLLENTLAEQYYIFCGKGNNGGDGLAIARQLSDIGKDIKVFILESNAIGTDDFNKNFNHLHHAGKVPITLIRSNNEFPQIRPDIIIVDAIFGIGINRKAEGLSAMLIAHLNASGNVIISIDLPSGMLCDSSSADFSVVKAHHTLTFQCLKMAFLMAENEPFFGQIHILDINLHPDFTDTIETKFNLINKSICQSIFKTRREFAHKGDFGHALLIAGSYGKMGAAVLSAAACMKSGVGLLTCHVPASGLEILQTAVPEAMCRPDQERTCVSAFDYDIAPYQTIGCGPGIGTGEQATALLRILMEKYENPIILDADALNILAINKEWLSYIPKNSVLTPHPKEFARLFGEGLNDYEKIEVAMQKASELKVTILLKGHYSFIATPGGLGYFNITGNAGMATGGSGDVLTGILTGLLAQDYTPTEAAILGVFIHGLAGDLAAGEYSMEAMTARDIIAKMGNAFIALGSK